MAKNEQESTEAILKSAAALADTLGLTRVDETPIFVEGQIVLVASKFGIEFGIVKVSQSVIREYFVTEYILNGEILAKHVQKQNKEGLIEPFRQTAYYHEEAVVYTGF